MNKLPMDVLRIVENYLIDNGFDGLYEPEGECACRLSGISGTGIAPCGQIGHDCRPGHLFACTTPGYCGKGCEWHIGDGVNNKALL